MKIRLTQPGFESYNGQMGVTFFENGLSVSDVLTRDALRMSAVMLCEWEDGTPASVAQSILDNANTPAPIFVAGANGQHDIASAPVKVSKTEPPASRYSREYLGAIADKDGIRGLREIGDPLNIKSNSIKDLIDAIMVAAQPKA